MKIFLVLPLLFFTISFITSENVSRKSIKSNRDELLTKKMSKITKSSAYQSNHDSMSDLDVLTIMKECNETFRIEMEYAESLRTTGSFPDETDKTPKCFVRCVQEKTGAISADGKFDPIKTLMVFIEPKNDRDIPTIEEMNKCTDRQEKCKCDQSYQVVKCLIKMELEKEQH